MYKIRLYVVPEQEEIPEDEEDEDECSPPALQRRNSRRSAAVRVNVLQKERRLVDTPAAMIKPRQISMKPRNDLGNNLGEKHGLLRQHKIISQKDNQERIGPAGNLVRKDGPQLPPRNVFASPKIKQLALDLQEKMMERNAKIRGNNLQPAANRPINPISCRPNPTSSFKKPENENILPIVLSTFAQEHPTTRTLANGNNNNDDDDNNNNNKNRIPDDEGMNNNKNRDTTAGQYINVNNNSDCKDVEEKFTDNQDRLLPRIPNTGPTNKRGACEYLENRTEVLVFGKNCRNRDQFHGRSPKIVRVKEDAGGDQGKDVLDGDVTAVLKDKDERSQTVVLRRNSKLNGYKEYDLEQKIEVEIKMREGSARLLAAARHRAQSLEAARALLTSNERMSAYMAELQRRKREPSNKFSTSSGSTARVSLSELRVPLMWRDSDHFKNRGDYRRFAVFCLARVGTEIHDTALLCPVDRALTDISFPDVLVFNNVSADFDLTLEIYSHILQEDLSIASTPRRIKRTIHSSISKTVGKKLAASLRDELNSGKIGPHFELMASARLTLDDTDDNIHTHDLVINNLENKHHSLPLFGHFCCRLAAQPDCINKEVCSGNISLNGRNYWARLQGFSIQTWESRKLAEEEQNSIHTIPINKETSIQLSKSSPEELRIMNSIDGSEKVTLVRLESNEDAQRWLRQLVAHAKDHLRWKRAAETIQEVPCVESARNSFISNKRQGSLYDETPLIESVQSDYATSRPTVQEIFGLTPSTSLSSCSSTNSPPSLRSRSLSTSGTRKLSASALKSHWPFSNKSHD